VDPYENFNRPVYSFNHQLDKLILKPVARGYTQVLPAPVRAGVNHFYSNLNMVPTIVNDVLQAQGTRAILDSWRLFINSTLGIGGILDVANTFSLPPHSNDLGITFAKWGDTHSPFIMVPFLGPTTVRDGFGMLFDCVFTPYFYISPTSIVWGLLALRYVDLRSQLLDTDKLLDDALDPYTMFRDAYMQHRNAVIAGEKVSLLGAPLKQDLPNEENLYVAE